MALYEDGLLPGLASLGLAAYVGAPEEAGWQMVSWDNGLGGGASSGGSTSGRWTHAKAAFRGIGCSFSLKESDVA